MFLYRVDCLGVFYSEKMKKKKLSSSRDFSFNIFFFPRRGVAHLLLRCAPMVTVFAGQLV